LTFRLAAAPTTTGSPTPAPSTSSQTPPLAATGTAVGSVLVTGLAVLLLGIALALGGRRRRDHQH
jgi:hypothetical protein